MRAFSTAIFVMVFAAPGVAQERAASADKARLTVAPYLWAPNIQGKVSLGPLSVPVDLNVSDLAGGIKAGGMGYAQFGNDRKFIYAEAIVIGFGDKSFAPFLDQAVTARVAFIEGGAGLHRTLQLAHQSVRVSPYAGFRYLALKARIGGPALRAAGSNAVFDPAVGMIVEAPVAPRITFIGKLDGAGLGLTSNDYFNVTGLGEFRLSQHVFVAGGYRYSKGTFPSARGLGMSLHGQGPMIGLRVVTGKPKVY